MCSQSWEVAGGTGGEWGRCTAWQGWAALGVEATSAVAATLR